MESTLPQENRKVFQRKSIITIADNNSDIVIKHIPLKVWIEGDVACFEASVYGFWG